ncbi:DEAD/DEAH box helicase domain-containing protein [Toxoplasma gondii GAB2-2007-GAL-DOM2]|uniref:RNA helicase n=2 Tax=Toxoplasma gondii TaxID=5811 RepID=V4YUI3_TOXGV|nr:DEAD/DEAH box helicase domain-containing protein [Toxoplasma gondii VEG]KFG30777.1 DEAD/DEAH box helicase domain-containing protein [Toxoplasma gondii GAB2-2007-GAL-DOM2]KFG34648.1 DEAD/DEAH box helicase domain-containing protein [Toxoplasma gondii p89]CEL74050.1 TPA: ATP-dependent RNA helicase, putative [Toxoplasma gondii VEG]
MEAHAVRHLCSMCGGIRFLPTLGGSRTPQLALSCRDAEPSPRSSSALSFFPVFPKPSSGFSTFRGPVLAPLKRHTSRQLRESPLSQTRRDRNSVQPSPCSRPSRTSWVTVCSPGQPSPSSHSSASPSFSPAAASASATANREKGDTSAFGSWSAEILARAKRRERRNEVGSDGAGRDRGDSRVMITKSDRDSRIRVEESYNAASLSASPESSHSRERSLPPSPKQPDTLLKDDTREENVDESASKAEGTPDTRGQSTEKNKRLRHSDRAEIEGGEGLLSPTMAARLRALGVASLFQVQRQMLRHLLQEEIDNALVLSPTGTGKTLSFLLPLLQRIEGERWPRTEPVLIVAPTRELAEQIAFEAWRLRTSQSTEIALVFGSSAFSSASADASSSLHRLREAEESFLLRSGAHVVVGTPGRLRELIEKTVLLHTDQQKFVILDEADKLLSRGLEADVVAILRATQNPDRRIFAFSATFPKWLRDSLARLPEYDRRNEEATKRRDGDAEAEEALLQGQGELKPLASLGNHVSVSSMRIIDLCNSSPFSSLTENPKKSAAFLAATVPASSSTISDPLFASSEEDPARQSNITHMVCRLPRQQPKRIRALLFLLKARLLDPHPDLRGIIFCNSRQQASLLAYHPLLEPVAKPLHADMIQSQRSATLKAFVRGDFPILIATDLAARGLDLPRVGLVVHYGVPQSAEVYVHRAGRTGRPQRLSERRHRSETEAEPEIGELRAEEAGEGNANVCSKRDTETTRVVDDASASAARGDEARAWTAAIGRQRGKERRNLRGHESDEEGEQETPAGGVFVQHGESILLLDRGQQQGLLLRKFENTIKARFRELDAPDEETMVQHSLREIESQLLSPQVVPLLSPFLPFSSTHLSVHGPRLLAAALALLLQRQQRITWRSALSGRFNFTPLLFHDPFYQEFKRKEDLLALLRQVLPRSFSPASNIGRIAYCRKGLLVDLPSGAARAVLASEELKRRKIKVTFAATLPHVVGDELRARVERTRLQRDPEKVIQQLQKRIHNARSKRARIRVSKQLARHRERQDLSRLYEANRRNSFFRSRSTSSEHASSKKQTVHT